MMLTEQKHKTLSDIQPRVYSAIVGALYTLNLNAGRDDIASTIANAVTQGVMAGLSELIDKTYTTHDFEKDLGIRS